ncbi:hypothetical protein IJG72_07190 [bacterium]|nr:hypothetical protein [bacterium]
MRIEKINAVTFRSNENFDTKKHYSNAYSSNQLVLKKMAFHEDFFDKDLSCNKFNDNKFISTLFNNLNPGISFKANLPDKFNVLRNNNDLSIFQTYSDEEMYTLANYINSFNKRFNPLMRGIHSKSAIRTNNALNEYAMLDCMDSLFDKAPHTKNKLVLYRGVKFDNNSKFKDMIDNLKVGDIFTDNAYISATTSINEAKKYGTSLDKSIPIHIFKITVPRKNKVLKLKDYTNNVIFNNYNKNSLSNDYLLNRNSNLRITNISQKNNLKVIDATYQGSKPQKITVPCKKHSTLYSELDQHSEKELLKDLAYYISKGQKNKVYKIFDLILSKAENNNNANLIIELFNKDIYAESNNSLLKFFDNDENKPFFKDIMRRVKNILNSDIEYVSDVNLSKFNNVIISNLKYLKRKNTVLSDDMVNDLKSIGITLK